jgi:general secretion pathway protein N
MIKKLTIASLVLALLLLALVATFPARVAWNWQGGRVQGLQLAGISGTVWSGGAEQLSVNNIALGKLNWAVPVWDLLQRKPSVLLHLNGAIVGQAKVQQNGSELHIQDLNADANASWLKPALGIPALEPTGTINLHFSEIVMLQNGLPGKALGSLLWQNAGVTGLAQADLGNIRIDVQPSAGGISGQINSADAAQGKAALSVVGEFQLIGQEYTADVRLQPSGNNPNIEQALHWIGEPMQDGGRLLKIQGRIVLPEKKP